METHFPDNENAHRQLARERVLTDLRALATDAQDLLRVTADDVSDKAKEARVRVTAALERAQETCDELHDQGVESAQAAVKKADSAIRENPYQSLGVAFVVGLLLGAVILRK